MENNEFIQNLQNIAANAQKIADNAIFTARDAANSVSNLNFSRLNYNSLYGKKWCVIGDSFTNDFTKLSPFIAPDDWFFKDGKYKGCGMVYARLIAERNNMTLQWMAENGRTLAYPKEGSPTNSFAYKELYKQIDDDVDYITIMLGINDSHHAPDSRGEFGEEIDGKIFLGTPSDKTIYTFYGAWNVVLSYIIEHYPKARVGIIVTNGLDFNSHRLAIIDMAKKYGLPFIDFNGGDGRTQSFHRTQNPDIPLEVREVLLKKYAFNLDPKVYNTHPNKLAHSIQADIVEQFLRSL